MYVRIFSIRLQLLLWAGPDFVPAECIRRRSLVVITEVFSPGSACVFAKRNYEQAAFRMAKLSYVLGTELLHCLSLLFFFFKRRKRLRLGYFAVA